MFKSKIIQDLGLEQIWTADNEELHDLENLLTEFVNCANSEWEEGLIDLTTFKPMLINTAEPIIRPIKILREQRPTHSIFQEELTRLTISTDIRTLIVEKIIKLGEIIQAGYQINSLWNAISMLRTSELMQTKRGKSAATWSVVKDFVNRVW